MIEFYKKLRQKAPFFRGESSHVDVVKKRRVY